MVTGRMHLPCGVSWDGKGVVRRQWAHATLWPPRPMPRPHQDVGKPDQRTWGVGRGRGRRRGQASRYAASRNALDTFHAFASSSADYAASSVNVGPTADDRCTGNRARLRASSARSRSWSGVGGLTAGPADAPRHAVARGPRRGRQDHGRLGDLRTARPAHRPLPDRGRQPGGSASVSERSAADSTPTSPEALPWPIPGSHCAFMGRTSTHRRPRRHRHRTRCPRGNQRVNPVDTDRRSRSTAGITGEGPETQAPGPMPTTVGLKVTVDWSAGAGRPAALAGDLNHHAAERDSLTCPLSGTCCSRAGGCGRDLSRAASLGRRGLIHAACSSYASIDE